MMLSTAYYGLFCVSEIAGTKSGHAARAKDVQIASNKNKFMFLLRSSKTHSEGLQPQIIKISSDGFVKGATKKSQKQHNLFCPYRLLHDFAQNRPPYKEDDEQFFVFSDGSPVMAHVL